MEWPVFNGKSTLTACITYEGQSFVDSDTLLSVTRQAFDVLFIDAAVTSVSS